MSQEELNGLVNAINRVLLTRATTGGATAFELGQDYKTLCGSEINWTKFGYRNLEGLLRAFPDQFSFQGGKWFGVMSKDDEAIVRSMATEKGKKRHKPQRGGINRGPQGFRHPIRPNHGPPQGFSIPGLFQQSLQPFTPNCAPQYHHSASDSGLSRYASAQGRQFREDRPSLTNFHTKARGPQIPPRFGFGNASYTARSETESLKSGYSSSSEENRDPDYPAECDPRLSRSSSVRRSISGDHQSRPGVRAASTSLSPPPGLESVKEQSRPSTPVPPSSCRYPPYPPGLDVRVDKSAPSAPLPSRQTDADNNAATSLQQNYLEIAQQVYDLLTNVPEGMSVREISRNITLPQRNGELHDPGKVGIAVISYRMTTFSLNSMGADGIVTLRHGAARPGSEMRNPQEVDRNRPSYQCNRNETSRNSARPGPAREEKGYGDNYDERDRLSAPEADQSRFAPAPLARETEARSSRFSAPVFNDNPHRRSPSPNRPRPQKMPSYNDEEEYGRSTQTWGSVCNYTPRRAWGDPRGDSPDAERMRARDVSPELRPAWGGARQGLVDRQDDGGRMVWPNEARAAHEHERYYQYGGPAERNGYPRPVPQEPKKFECKHEYLMDPVKMPYKEKFKVILTHFVALDEFYVRFTDEELVYERMLTELREDYKGKLEYTERQLWLKGDGVAVWQDRQWQRAVVCSPPTNATAAQTSSLDVFLIDVGKTVTISKDQVLPLHNFYHRPPFAVCCSVGHFDICRGRRSDLVEECDKMAASFLRAGVNALEAEIIGKIWDDKEKLQVRLLYRENQGVYVPDYFAEEKIIQLR